MEDNEFHPAVVGATATDMEAGTMQSITEAIKFGVPAAAYSGYRAIANTMLDYAGKDMVDTEESIRGYSEQMGDYYADRKEAIDIVGQVGVSLIPGTLGMKGLQLARAGYTTGTVGRALNLTASGKEKYLRAALQDVATTGGVIPKLASANRMKYLAAETADQAFLALAGEAAIVATMHDGSLFENQTYKDFAWNMALGAGIGGAVGGVVGSLMGKGILRAASETVQAQSRGIDTVFDATEMGLSKGTETLQLAAEIQKLYKPVGDLPFSFKLDGKQLDETLRTSGALQANMDRAVKTAENTLAIKFTELAGGDAMFGQSYLGLIKQGIEGAKMLGKDADEVTAVINGYLSNVSRVGPIDLTQYAQDSSRFWVNTVPRGNTPMERLKNLFSTTQGKDTSRQAYRLAEGATAENIVIEDFANLGYDSLKTAFKSRPDIDVVRLADGRVSINPRSEAVKRVGANPYLVRKYANLETGTITPEALPHFADVVAKGDIRVTDNAINASGKHEFKMPASTPSKLTANPLEASARWAWASQLDAKRFMKITGGRIDTADLPMFARAGELRADLGADFDKLKFVEKGKELSAAEFVNMSEALNGYRRDAVRAALGDPTINTSTQHLAAHLNTSIDYVDNLIASGYNLAKMPTEVVTAGAHPTAHALVPRNAMVEWNFGVAKQFLPEEAYNMNMGPAHLATKELTRQYQMLIRADVGTKSQQYALGSEYANFMAAPSTADVTAEGAGATVFGASNADYVQRAKLWVQNTGKSVALATQRFRDAAIEELAPAVNGIRNDARAAAELGSITTALRKSPHRFSLVDSADPVTGKVLVSREAKKAMDSGKFATLEDAVAHAAAQDGLQHMFPVRSTAVRDFLQTAVKQNDLRGSKFTSLHNAAGLTTNGIRAGEIYVPPVNTQKYPFFALVKSKQKVGLGTDTTMITARSEEQLRKYIGELEQDFDIFLKADTDAYYKARAEYDYGMTVNEGAINSVLHRRGILADVMPETRAENVLTDWLEHTARQEEKLVRTAVQVGNRQFFSELQFLSANYRSVAESQVRGLGAKLKAKIADPFNDYTKTALNISKQGEFPLLDSLNEFVDKVGYQAGEALASVRSRAESGLLKWTEAEQVMKQYGLGQGLSPEMYQIANEVYPSNVIKDVLAKGNMWLATVTLRLDFANSLVNMISTPIMLGTEVASLKRMIAGDSDLAKAFKDVMHVAGPGGRSMPSTTKLLSASIGNFFGADKAALLERYKRIGAIKDVSQLYHEVLDDLSYKSVINPSRYADTVNKAVEKGAKITGNTFSEDLTRFVSADVMRQISDPLVAAGKLTAKEQDAYISTFVNRVQGNYVTSQRPVVFQGTTGAAVSLFQTYAFNVLQQLTRHIENGDKRTLMLFAGLQSSIFGLNGLPFFDAVNTHLVGSWLNNNPQHKDSYNILPAFNKELGDWALYGSASAFPLFGDKAPALYTRGDINPRHITILPTSFADIPLVNAAGRMYDTVLGLGKNVNGGADISTAMLQALEHQGWNRPLAGLAQTLQGASTTSRGAVVSAANELDTTSKLSMLQDRLVDFGGVSRLMGARPMDEAVALNNLYRNKAYDALDKERIERLGIIVKTRLANGQSPSQDEMEDFMLRYARSGGRIEGFSSAMQRWTRDANVSIVNQTMARVGTSSGIKMQQLMGGEGLQDYVNRPEPLGADE